MREKAGKCFFFVIGPELVCKGDPAPSSSLTPDAMSARVRVVNLSRGIKYLAPIIAFFEIVIWLFAPEAIMNDLSEIVNFVAVAPGFATRTYFRARH